MTRQRRETDRSDRQRRRSNFIRVTVDRTRRGRILSPSLSISLSLLHREKGKSRAFARSAHNGPGWKKLLIEACGDDDGKQKRPTSSRGSLGLWKALIARPSLTEERQRDAPRCARDVASSSVYWTRGRETRKFKFGRNSLQKSRLVTHLIFSSRIHKELLKIN